MSDVDKAVVMFDHLGGCAREEVFCHSDAVRNDYGALVALLKLHFAPHETVHSLSAEFCAQVQLPGETLAEYSRVLMGLRNRMEKAAATGVEGHELALLRDTALKYQFIEGVQEQSVRRELRRIAFHSAGSPFHHTRNEALYLFDNEEHPGALQGGDLSLSWANTGGDRAVAQSGWPTSVSSAGSTRPSPETAHVSIVGNMVISSENVPTRGLHPHHLVAGVAPVSVVSRRATLSAIARRRSV